MDTALRLCGNVNCASPADRPKLLRCTACKQSAYCSKACQLESRSNGHRLGCRMLKTAAGSRRASNELSAAITRRLETARTLCDAKNDTELGKMQEQLLADADVMHTMPGKERECGFLYSVLAKKHLRYNNLCEADHLLLLAKNMADRTRPHGSLLKFKFIYYRDFAKSCVAMGRTKQAVVLFEECLVLQAQMPVSVPRYQQDILSCLARCHLNLGAYTRSLDMVKQAHAVVVVGLGALVELPPDNAAMACKHMRIRAQCHLALREYKKALFYFALLLHYATRNTNCEETMHARMGISTTIWAQTRWHANVLELQGAGQNSASCLKGTPLRAYCERLQRSLYWLKQNSPFPDIFTSVEMLRLHTDTLLRAAFLQYDLFRYLRPAILSPGLPHEYEVMALKNLRVFLDSQLKVGPKFCDYCHQTRHDQDEMLMCSGCGVARFCNKEHQTMSSARLGTRTGRCVVRHKVLCKLLQQYKIFLQNTTPDSAQIWLDIQRAFLNTEAVY